MLFKRKNHAQVLTNIAVLETELFGDVQMGTELVAVRTADQIRELAKNTAERLRLEKEARQREEFNSKIAGTKERIMRMIELEAKQGGSSVWADDLDNPLIREEIKAWLKSEGFRVSTDSDYYINQFYVGW